MATPPDSRETVLASVAEMEQQLRTAKRQQRIGKLHAGRDRWLAEQRRKRDAAQQEQQQEQESRPGV